MKKLGTLVLALLMLSGRALAQDSKEPAKDPTIDQLKEMQRSLAEQQEQIQKLRQEAAQRDEALREMQQKVQKQLDEAQATADKAAAQAQAQAQPAAAGAQKAGVFPAAFEKSAAPVLAQTASNTQAVFSSSDPQAAPPPWAMLKMADNVSFRFGGVLQPTVDFTQDPNSEGYSQNYYLRRARFNVQANLPAGVTVFFQTDDPRVGNAGTNGAKNINSGFLIQDAWAQWAFLGKAMSLQAGLFLVPTERQVLTSVATFLALDLPTWSQQENATEEANGGRDYGVGLNGALLGDKLTYRFGVFSGYRDVTHPLTAPLGAAAGSRNPPRIAGRLQYDFFDTEYVYSYAGTNLGKKKILAIAGGGDSQGNYKAYFADAFFDWPVGPGAVTVEGDYMHEQANPQIYNIGGTPTTLPEQDTFYTNAGYYFCDFKIQPFFRYEFLNYARPIDIAKEQTRIGGGINYYVLWQNFKITAYYEKIEPKVKPATAAIQDLNRFVMQFQGSF
jgi:hypothetical protein